MKLGDKILMLRKKEGMSQEQLAEKLDVSRQAVSRWELGSALPDANNIRQLSRVFAVSADYLLNEDTPNVVFFCRLCCSLLFQRFVFVFIIVQEIIGTYSEHPA